LCLSSLLFLFIPPALCPSTFFPYTTLFRSVPIHSEANIQQVLKQSHDAFSSWSARDAHERSALIQAWSQKVKDHIEDIAELVTLENGKPLVESRGEVTYSTDY